MRDVGTEEWTQQGALALRETYLGYFFYTQGTFSKGGEKDKRSEICSNFTDFICSTSDYIREMYQQSPFPKDTLA